MLSDILPVKTTSDDPYFQHSGYDIPVPEFFTIELQNPDYADWAIRNFVPQIDTGPDADPDGDGVRNLIEFLTETAPLNSFDHPLLEMILGESVEASKFMAQPDVRYHLGASKDLINWELIREVYSTDGPIEIRRDSVGDAPFQLYRLNFER